MFRYYTFVILWSIFSSQVAAKCEQRRSAGLLNEASLIDDLARLSSLQMAGRKTGSAGSIKARNILQNRYRQIGLKHFSQDPEYIQKFSFPKSSSKNQGFNVVGWLEGTGFPEQFIVLTAHYDHLGVKGRHVYYGADDNASGVAALLAVAGQTAKFGLAHSIIFLATDAEERGLYGAKAFVKNLPINKNAILLNINLDMLGEGGRRNRLYATFSRGNTQLAELVKNVSAIASLCFISGHRKSQRFNKLSHKVNWHKASDHAAFAQVDIPYLFIGGGVHSRYHTVKDNFENINQRFFISAAETAWQIVQTADTSLKRN